MAPPAESANPAIVPAPAREYEFGPPENAVFSALATQMRFVGTAQGVAGAFLVVMGVVHVWVVGPPGLMSSVPMAIVAALLVVTGTWLRNASQPVAAIVSTEGNDIRHLMDAMVVLARMFALQRVFLLVVGVAAVLGAIGVMVLLAFFAETVGRFG
jgi:hypothetical protein